ncbi:LysR substrate-binding domain-containing protein [Paraburkholderia haematera]|uniref:HTH-type transcriptional regulator TsaR n=1 Tax=Paraburkholderia haematera TaxID=2793077 RepID=A0ABN7LTH3_9BURK|nr:LysR substrate-binding domain-containing protein [Paraburkholderia haematera]CAE6765708.1 HTH-type transcriptional regulator TsaR [Paraburkholderia haematera]
MKLHQLQALVASAEAGSIRGAARALGLSQAAVTRALRELETSEGLPLLIRATEGINLTEYGKVLLNHAKLVLNQLSRAQNDLARLRGRSEERLSVGITPWITLTFLTETVLSFRQRMPNVRLELFESLMAVAQPLLRSGDMDFAIGPLHSSAAMQEFAGEPILTYETAVMVRDGHPRQGCRSIHDLLDQDWVLNFAPDGRETILEHLFHRHGATIDEQRIVRAQSLAMQQLMVEDADMCTWCPAIIAAAPSFRRPLRALTLKEQFEPIELSIIMRRNGTLSTAARCFAECLLQVIRQHARSAKKQDVALFETLRLLA